MRYVHPSTSVKIITAMDAGLTLAVEHVGYTLHLPFYHPVILGSVLGGTYLLLKHREYIASSVVSASEELWDNIKYRSYENTWRYE